MEIRVQGQQEVEQSLPAQGDVQSTVGLQAGGVGAAILRAMEVGLEVAAPEAVREIRPDDRGALGRDRVVLPGGEQGALGLRGRDQQQDPRDPTTGLRTSRRRVPPPQNPDVHAAGNLKSVPKLPTRLGEEPELLSQDDRDAMN